jgi:hypothetical protein
MPGFTFFQFINFVDKLPILKIERLTVHLSKLIRIWTEAFVAYVSIFWGGSKETHDQIADDSPIFEPGTPMQNLY